LKGTEVGGGGGFGGETTRVGAWQREGKRKGASCGGFCMEQREWGKWAVGARLGRGRGKPKKGREEMETEKNGGVIG